jgi:hypothetical protein
LLGHRDLFGSQRGQHGIAVHRRGRSDGPLTPGRTAVTVSRSSSTRSTGRTAAASFTASFPASTSASTRTIGPLGARRRAGAPAAARPWTTSRSIAPTATGALLAIPTLLAIIVIATPGTLGRARSEDDRHVGRPSGCPDDLNAPLGLHLGMRRLHGTERQDLYALEPSLDLGPQDGADGLSRRHQGTVEDTLGLSGSGGAPGPRPLTALARQLNIDPA